MSIQTIEPAYHPNQRMSLLLDWLVTLKCNYNCSYCPPDDTGHDNSIPHPAVGPSLLMIDQMYEYADILMSHKKEASKSVIMQLRGGEVIYHPGVIELMKHTSEKYQQYKDRWRLKRRLTTNGTATEKSWRLICEHVEGVTMSYHSQGAEKLKKMFRNNLLYLGEIKKEHDTIVCMYPHADHWNDCIEFLRWAKEKGVNARPRLLDGPLGMYGKQHLADLGEFIDPVELMGWKHNTRAGLQTRACCGGRKVCFDRQLRKTNTLVPRGPDGFKGWHCSANQFFLFGNNITGKYFTNRDCHVKVDGTTGHIADINTMPDYIANMKKQQQLPTLVCAQTRCVCGTCAPKSVSPDTLKEIMQIYNTVAN